MAPLDSGGALRPWGLKAQRDGFTVYVNRSKDREYVVTPEQMRAMREGAPRA